MVHFTFSTDRKQQTPLAYFREYSGTLMCDEYAGYVNADYGLLLSCWAHARRYVEKAKHIEPAFAAEVLLAIGKLYLIERDIRQAAPEERQHAREAKSRPQVEKVFELLKSRTFLPQSPMQKARNYILNCGDRLKAYTTDERLPIDNNLGERDPATCGNRT